MTTTRISTYSMADSSRSQLMRQTTLVDRLKQEMSSLRHYDIGLELGGRTGEAVTVRSEFQRLKGLVDTNALLSSRLGVTQSALDDILNSGQEMLKTLIAVRDAGGASIGTQNMGQGNLKLLISRLNIQPGGVYVFGGINTGEVPVTDYYSDPAPANKAALDAAFLAEFGFSQSDPAAAGISAAAMQTFLDGAFQTLFDDPQWGNTWSSATDDVMKNAISTGETADTTVSANDKAFRQLAAAYTMIGELGITNLNAVTLQVVVDKAISVLGGAVSGVTQIKGGLGLVEARVTASSERLNMQADVLNKRVLNLENINPEETSVRLNTALTQLETTYAVSARMQKLSILNYL
ncbi:MULTISPECIES: flagellar hook-associated family protein [unclassified Pannonibacter]|uniref:flagellar hook-associated family protein n=1 Tax=unclassified Pannonibacter TaxID=2627228 RepID=UPI00164554A2|nr:MULTISPECIES: flagellar hook-associated family protein [unclassified Pannonibacter]